MACFHPIVGFRSKFLNASGKRSIVFNSHDAISTNELFKVTVPCGQCIGCRLERSRQWAVRCLHESSLHDSNCFITLTYSDEHLPSDGSLDVTHFQKFMKRLRARYGKGIRYFHCGEYGDRFLRPHYHACLFNFDFPDLEFWKTTSGGRLYVSASLQELWPYGFSTVGAVTFDSAAYVARYVMKKVNGPLAEAHYSSDFLDVDTGELSTIVRKPEYVTMSRRPGIGADWYDKYQSDVYKGDFVVVNGRKVRPPKFYDSRYLLDNPEDYIDLKSSRRLSARTYASNNTVERLEVRERVQLAKLSLISRGLDKEI